MGVRQGYNHVVAAVTISVIAGLMVAVAWYYDAHLEDDPTTETSPPAANDATKTVEGVDLMPRVDYEQRPEVNISGNTNFAPAANTNTGVADDVVEVETNLTNTTAEKPEELVPTGTEDWDAYAHATAGIEFRYPQEWEVKEDYYYETAANVESVVPTLTIGKADEESDIGSTNRISINLRQADCMLVEPYDERTVSVGDVPITYYTFYDEAQVVLGTRCVEARVDGVDVNGDMASYHFVSFYDDRAVEEVFSGVVASFSVIE